MPKCKTCNTKFVKTRAIQPTCSNYDCMVAYGKKVAEKARNKRIQAEKKVLREKTKTLSDYLKEAQQVFNKYIRLRDKGQPCISCDAKNYTVSCGHYYPSGKYKSVTFDEDNCHAQCWWFCNSKMSGNLINYRVGLIAKIGQERFEQLEQRAKQIKQWKKHELIEIISTYKLKIKELQNK